jgi:hypothetical protein
MTKTIQDETLFGFSNFGHWKLFDIWDLIFEISIKQGLSTNQIPSGDNQNQLLWARIFTLTLIKFFPRANLL